MLVQQLTFSQSSAVKNKLRLNSLFMLMPAAILVLTLSGCATKDSRMKSQLGKHISEIQAYYQTKNVSNYSENGNLHTWVWHQGEPTYMGRKNLGTYRNQGMGTGTTTYYTDICRLFWHRDEFRVNQQSIAVEYKYRTWSEPADCR